MTTKQMKDEEEIRRRIEKHVSALQAMDLDAVMSNYASDIVSFDVGGQFVGTEAKRKVWADTFAMILPPLNFEIRDLVISTSDGMAFSHCFNKLSATLKYGPSFGSWVRWTACFRKFGNDWLIVHDQVSLAYDFENGKAILDFVP